MAGIEDDLSRGVQPWDFLLAHQFIPPFFSPMAFHSGFGFIIADNYFRFKSMFAY